jgi:putative radical SAM enzyme (TIGR03279 family)
MKKHEHIIKEIVDGSIAWELELEPGDKVLAINDTEIGDIFDYQYLTEDEELILLVEKADGEQWELEIEKDMDEDLGIVFEEGLMDEYRSCHNKCIFCFIDQMPPGMRKTLYFKDDDSRLSFLQGNYITLTNMSDEDVDRIIRYRLAPINISVHTTNPELRCKMLSNRFAGKALDKMKKFYEAGILMNSQIVLCKGINDGEELERTIEDLSKYLPYMQSLSVVPIGLTKYREGLYPMEPFGKEDAREVLDIIHKWQKKLEPVCGGHFVHASDEWFILAELPFPDEDYYDGYEQLENGVGMMRLLISEFTQSMAQRTGDDKKRKVTIATAKLAYETICYFAKEIEKKYPNTKVQVVCITNDFFGESITVTGLMTGGDIIRQVKDLDLGDALILPENVLKADEPIFLDDLSVTDMEEALSVPVRISPADGEGLIDTVLGE